MILTSILFKTIKITLITLLVIFALYNTAAFFNLLPQGFSAGEVFGKVKTTLSQAATDDDLSGSIAKALLGPINRYEKYHQANAAYDAEQAKIASECKENIWVRRMMLLGEPEEKKQGCWGKGDPMTRATEAVESFEANEQKKIDMLNSL